MKLAEVNLLKISLSRFTTEYIPLKAKGNISEIFSDRLREIKKLNSCPWLTFGVESFVQCI